MTVSYDHMTPVQAFVDGSWQVAVVRMECGPPSRPTALVSLLDHDVAQLEVVTRDLLRPVS